jgi:hypothetical protein
MRLARLKRRGNPQHDPRANRAHAAGKLEIYLSHPARPPRLQPKEATMLVPSYGFGMPELVLLLFYIGIPVLALVVLYFVIRNAVTAGILRAEKLECGHKSKVSNHGERKRENDGKYERGMYRATRLLISFRTEELCNNDTRTATDARHEVYYKRAKRSGTSDSSESRRITRELTYHPFVGGVVKHLQKTRSHNGKCKKYQSPKQGSRSKIYSFFTHSF